MVLKIKEAKFEGAPRRYKLDSVEMAFVKRTWWTTLTHMLR